MGVVVNKSFNKIRKDILKKAIKLSQFIENNESLLKENWSARQNRFYYKLEGMTCLLCEELSYLDEVSNPDDLDSLANEEK